MKTFGNELLDLKIAVMKLELEMKDLITKNKPKPDRIEVILEDAKYTFSLPLTTAEAEMVCKLINKENFNMISILKL